MVSAEADVTVEQGFLEVVGDRIKDVDSIIIDYVVKVLQDETFDFGPEGKEAYDAVGALLVAAELVDDEKQAKVVRN